MTVQPNDRKQELTPEFQDEAGKRANPARGKESRRTGTGRSATDRTGTDKSASDSTVNDSTANDGTGNDRAVMDKSVTDKTATDRAADQAGVEGAAAERAGAERTDTGRTETGQTETGRTETGRTETGHGDTGHAGAVANKDRTEVVDQAGNKPVTQQDANRHHAADDTRRPENQAPVAARTRLFEDQDISRYREQWRELQAGFVDEPRSAVREAETLVSQMMETLTAQLNEQKRALAGNSDAVDTEQLRVTLQRYRSLFDQMLSV